MVNLPTPLDHPASKVQRLVDISKRKSGIQLPISFVRDKSETPPLAQMLRGGRGGAVRLKLYLTFDLLAAAAPHKIDRPISARTWAEVIGLDDPDAKGARRVADALNWLDKSKFIKLERHSGQPPYIHLLNSDRKGKSLSKASWPYVTLPLGYWENGWIEVLSGRATAIYLMLTELTGGINRESSQFVSMQRALEYGVSSETWYRGSQELELHGLITTQMLSRGERDLDWQRRRKIYTLKENGLSNPAIFKNP